MLGINGIQVVGSIIVIFHPSVEVWDFFQNNVNLYSWFFYVGGFLYILWVSMMKKNRDALIMLSVVMVLLISTVLDVLSGQAIINLPPLSTYFLFSSL